jgi:hypothetical protein
MHSVTAKATSTLGLLHSHSEASLVIVQGFKCHDQGTTSLPKSLPRIFVENFIGVVLLVQVPHEDVPAPAANLKI